MCFKVHYLIPIVNVDDIDNIPNILLVVLYFYLNYTVIEKTTDKQSIKAVLSYVWAY